MIKTKQMKIRYHHRNFRCRHTEISSHIQVHHKIKDLKELAQNWNFQSNHKTFNVNSQKNLTWALAVLRIKSALMLTIQIGTSRCVCACCDCGCFWSLAQLAGQRTIVSHWWIAAKLGWKALKNIRCSNLTNLSQSYRTYHRKSCHCRHIGTSFHIPNHCTTINLLILALSLLIH